MITILSNLDYVSPRVRSLETKVVKFSFRPVTKSAGRLVSNASEHLHSDNTLPWLEELGIVFQWRAHPVKWQVSSQVGLLEETLYS